MWKFLLTKFSFQVFTTVGSMCTIKCLRLRVSMIFKHHVNMKEIILVGDLNRKVMENISKTTTKVLSCNCRADTKVDGKSICNDGSRKKAGLTYNLTCKYCNIFYISKTRQNFLKKKMAGHAGHLLEKHCVMQEYYQKYMASNGHYFELITEGSTIYNYKHSHYSMIIIIISFWMDYIFHFFIGHWMEISKWSMYFLANTQLLWLNSPNLNCKMMIRIDLWCWDQPAVLSGGDVYS